MGQLKSEGPYRPTKAWRHTKCGGRLERSETVDGYNYYCEKCNELTTLKMGDVEIITIEE